jgi:hypothetical protein
MKPPAPRPCVTCPYRRDVPSGVWSDEEYEKLPPFDGETWEQPPSVFLCHQQDGKLCAGWVAVHDMNESFGLRLACSTGAVAPEDLDEILDYTTDVPLFDSGAEAAEHGLAEIDEPGPDAVKAVKKLTRKRQRE